MLYWFLYCAQVLWEKWCLYNKSCSYGNQDGCLLWKMLMFVWFRQQCCRLYLPVWPNITWDPFEGLCDRCMKVEPLTFHAHTLFHWTLPFDYSVQIISINRWAVAFWLSSSMVGRFHSTWVWQLCCSYAGCTVSLMSTWSQINSETLMGDGLPQLHSGLKATLPLLNNLWISQRFGGLINMSDQTSSVISWDYSYPPMPYFTPGALASPFFPLFSWNVLNRKVFSHSTYNLNFFHVAFCHASLVIKTKTPSVHPVYVFSQCLQWSHFHDVFAWNVACQNSFQLYLCSWVWLPLHPGSNWIWGL